MRTVMRFVLSISFLGFGLLLGQTPTLQTQAKRPLVGVALKTREGAPSAAAIGCLKALDELGVPVDLLAVGRTGALVGSLYATRHSYEEMERAFSELADIYTTDNASALSYPSDFRIRKFLTKQFGRFDLVTDADFSRLPVSFITTSSDLLSGDFVVLRDGSLAEAVRVSLSSPWFLQPVSLYGKWLVGDSSDLVAALKAKGADVVIQIADYEPGSFPLSPYALSKLTVSDRLQQVSNAVAGVRDTQLADVAIRLDSSSFETTSLGDVPALIRVGYEAVMAKKAAVAQLTIPASEMADHRSALDSSYRRLLAGVDNLVLSSIEVEGNGYLDKEWITETYELKTGVPFSLESAVSHLDKLYSSGHLRTCWITPRRSSDSKVRIVIHVVESEFLPPNALPKLTTALESQNTEERRFAAAAIGNMGPKGAEAANQLAALLTDKNRDVRSTAVHSLGELGSAAVPTLTSIVASLKQETDASVRRAAAWAIARIALSVRTEKDSAIMSSLADALSVVQQDPGLAEFQDAIGVSVRSLKDLQTGSVRGDESYTVNDPALQSWQGEGVSLNGHPVQVNIDTSNNEVRFLGGGVNDNLRQGLNVLTRGKQQALIWLEARKLAAYETPYKHSYAVVVAIDDYDRKHDPNHRPPTGYPALSAMVSNAKTLVETLQKLGFEREHIVSLYDERATSDAVEAALKSFWPGGPTADADRVLFYFGGHGDKYRNVPYLATYDFDKSKPTLTSTRMMDLTEQQSQNIAAKHVLFILDACDSGLTLRGLGSAEAVDQQMRRFQALSAIRRDTEQPARNILVAGTGEQQALWQNGGVFTRAIIDGLNGEADLNQDGIIQFEELGVFVRNRVTAQAAQAAVRQDPDFRVLDQYGSGRVVFVK
jgi:hypothetical protein